MRPERLSRLLDGIDFDVVLIDLSKCEDESMRGIVGAVRSACVVVERACLRPSEPGFDMETETLLYPFEHEAFAIAVECANRRRRQRFFVRGRDSGRLH